MSSILERRLNPFPGLRPFRSDEHHLFFGREDQTAALLQLLRQNRFLAVVGTSGSGKSSLVRAGMIAELHGGTMTQAGSTWEVMILRPGGSPIENLARAMLDADLYDAADADTLPRLRATLSRSRFGLVEAVKQSDVFEPDTNLLVVVDQFEELFRFRQQGAGSEEAAAAFVNLLLTASGQAERRIFVTITMRSDYLGDCSEIPGLAEAVNEGEYLIPRLLRDQKRDAIEKPIGVGGAKISPLLVQRLLNDVGDDPDQLPVLQHALMRMWNVWAADADYNRPIDFRDFEAIGGLEAALSNHADEIYESLPDERHRQACERIFKTLTEKGTDNRGIRRPTRLARLEAIADADRKTVVEVLDAFRRPGVTFLMPGKDRELDERTVLDLSHESLMRGWRRLRGWVEQEAQSARIFRRLLDTAWLWRDGKAGLFRDPDLQIALSWREEEQPNHEWAEQYGGQFETAIGFLENSEREVAAETQAREAARQRELQQAQQLAEARQQRLEQQQRAARKLRAMLAGLAVVAAIAGVACVAALVANNKANELADIARHEAENAIESAREAEIRRAEAAAAQQETKAALGIVERQKAEVQSSLTKVEQAEERGRHLLYATDMQLAAQLWRDEQVGAKQLRDQLQAHVPEAGEEDLRGFEWNYTQHLVDSSAQVFPGDVLDCAVTGAGQLVTLDQQGRLRRWDRQTGREVGTPLDLARGGSVGAVALSADGRLAGVVIDDEAHLFDATTGLEPVQFESAKTRLDLMFSPDGRMLVTLDTNIQWWDTLSGRLIASAATSPTRSYLRGLSISADGMTVAVSGLGGAYGDQVSIYRMDLATKAISRTNRSFGGTRGPVALSPDGLYFATCSFSQGPVSIYETAGFRHVVTNSSAHVAPLSAMAFSADGARLITADQNGMIKIWNDPTTLKSPAFTLKGHIGLVRKVFFSEDAKQIVSSGVDQTARVWDLRQRGVIRSLATTSGSGTAQQVRFSPDGLLIAAAVGNQLFLWDAATGERLRRLPGDDAGRVVGIAFSPDNRLLAAGFGGQANVSHVALWDIDTAERIAEFPGTTDLPNVNTDGNRGYVNALEFSPDGRFLVAGFGSPFLIGASGYRMPLKVWDMESRQLIRRLEGHTGLGTSCAFSQDGTRLATGNFDGTARIWDTATWTTLQTFSSPGGDGSNTHVADVAWSPDGQTLAMADYGGNIHLWDVAAGTLRESLTGHSNSVSSVAFSPDGLTLASAGHDETVRLWNLATSRELMQLDAGGVDLSRIYALAFSPDGRQLLFGGTSVAFWSTAPLLWNDPARAAEKLELLLDSAADFTARMRMFSRHVSLHEGLAQLQQRRPDDVQIQTALAAARSHWHAWRREWPRSTEAYDRLLELSPGEPEAWLAADARNRVATALLHQNRPLAAAALLTGTARQRTAELLPAATKQELLGEQPVDESLASLLALVNSKLDESPGDPQWLELRAELAGQWSGYEEQVADYTAAIAALSELGQAEAAADLQRLHGRRGRAYLALDNWQLASDDFARAGTDETSDEELLAGQAEAQAGLLLQQNDTNWNVLTPFEMTSKGGATLALQDDDGSILASGPNQSGDVYTIKVNGPLNVAAVRLEVLPDARLPSNGPGRHSSGNFQLSAVRLFRSIPDDHGDGRLPLGVRSAWASFTHPASNVDIAGTIDDALKKVWHVWSRRGESHVAEFLLDQPVSVAPGEQLTVVLEHQDLTEGINLGRFRISATDRPTLFAGAQQLVERMDDPWAKLAAAHRLRRDQQAVDDLVKRRPQIASAVGDLFTHSKHWRRAIEIYTLGITDETTDSDLLARRARALEQVQEWEAASADWSRAAAATLDGARLLAEFAQRLIENRQTELASHPAQQSQQLYEAALEADPENPVVAEELAGLLMANFVVENVILPTSEDEGRTWAWTTSQPPDNWMDADFDESSWARGPGGFGTTNTAGAVVRTTWNTNDIWLRRTFHWSAERARRPLLWRAHHDDEAQIYLNGKQVASLSGWTTEYVNTPVDTEAQSTLQPGTNTIAVHCRSLQGAQYIDVGLFRKAPTKSDPDDPATDLANAYALNGETAKAVRWFAKALDQATTQELRSRIIDMVRSDDQVLTQMLEARAADPLLQIAHARLLAERARAKLDQAGSQAVLPELKESWEIVDRLFKASPEPNWTTPAPIEMTSSGGATLTLQEDGSILAGGHLADDEVYSVVLELKESPVTAVRLETLPHASLPRGAIGREPRLGNFLVSEIEIEILTDREHANSAKKVAVRRAWADAALAKDGRLIEKTVDGDPTTHWTPYPQVQQPHDAVFEFEDPVVNTKATAVRITLDCRDARWKKHALGCFRLSLTGDPDVVAAMELRSQLPGTEMAELAATLGQAAARQGQFNEAAEFFAHAIERATERTAKARIIADAFAFEVLIDRLAKLVREDAQFQAALARQLAGQGELERAATIRSTARALSEAQLARSPEDPKLAEQLADLLLADSAGWTVLEPIELASAKGATLTTLTDHSILASGKNPLGDAYSIVAEAPATRVSAIRLEALTHQSLPNHGPGRDEQRDPGAFYLTEWEIAAIPSGNEPVPIPLSQAAADYSVQHIPVSVTGWNVGGGASRPHTAVFLAEEPVDFERGPLRLQFRMQFFDDPDWPLQNLGRFRLSVASDPAAFEREQRRFRAQQLTDPWGKLAVAYYLEGNQQAVDGLLQQHAELAVTLGDQFAADQAWEQAVEMYSRAITAETTDSDLLLKRAGAYEQLENWDAAAADLSRAAIDLLRNPDRFQVAFATFKKAERWSEAATFGWMLVEQNPEDTMLWLGLAPVIALAGDEAGYRTFCHRMAHQFQDTDNAAFADRVCKACLLAPKAIELKQLPHDVLAKSLDEGTAPQWLLPWAWACRALVAYRSGESAAAVEYIDKSLQYSPPETTKVLGLAIRGLAQHQLGEVDKARSDLQLAAQTGAPLFENDRNNSSHDLLIPRILLGEAEAVLAGRLAHNDPAGLRRAQKTSDGRFLQQAIAEYSRAIEEQGADFAALSQRARLYEQIQDWEAAAADWSRAAATHSSGPWLLTEFAQRLTARGLDPLAALQLQEARRLYENALEQDPENYVVADALTQLLISRTEEGSWTILTPTEMRSSGGATLTRQPDQSILAGGANPQRDTYVITTESLPPQVSVLRLETMPDPNLPAGGSGRSGAGNFRLTELRVYLVDGDGKKSVVTIKSATSTSPNANRNIEFALDGSPNTWWAVYPAQKEPQQATFVLDQPIAATSEQHLQVEIDSGSQSRETLGRFQLAATDEVVGMALARITDPWARLAAAYHLQGDQSAVDRFLARHPEAEAGLGDLYAYEQDWPRAIEMYGKAIAADPSNADVLAKRAEAYERLDDWEAAMADWMLAAKSDSSVRQPTFDKLKGLERWHDAATVGSLLVEMEPENPIYWQQQALMFVLAGDNAAYRDLCIRMTEQFAGTEDGRAARITCKACLLIPDAVDLAKLPTEPLVESLNDETAATVWGWISRAMVAYRSGDPASAVEYADKADEYSGNLLASALNRAVCASAREQLGDHAAAREDLQTAARIVETQQRNERLRKHNDMLIAQLLLREAESKLGGEEQP